MPVLGSATQASSGQVKSGVYLPTGWNTNWKAARDNSANALAEVVIFGDSTTYASCITQGINIYSWINKIRSLSVAAGYQDGGPGIVYSDTQDNHNYDGMVYLVSATGFNYGGGSFLCTPGAVQSNTVNDLVTFQGKGTAVRIHYATQPLTGSFSYSIDGGAAVTVNATNSSAYTGDTLVVQGLSDAVHTVTITNLGGGTANLVGINVEFVRSVGIVYHKNAIVGNATATYFSPAIPSSGMFGTQLMLGLKPGTAGAVFGLDWGQARATGAQYRKPALAISALGINDLQGVTPPATAGGPTAAETTTAMIAKESMVNNLTRFIRLSRAAGVDPLIVVPHFDMAARTNEWGGMFHAAVWNCGVSNGCAVIDFNQAIRPVSTMFARGLGSPGVHAEVATYDAEAAFLWNNALSV